MSNWNQFKPKHNSWSIQRQQNTYIYKKKKTTKSPKPSPIPQFSAKSYATLLPQSYLTAHTPMTPQTIKIMNCLQSWTMKSSQMIGKLHNFKKLSAGMKIKILKPSTLLCTRNIIRSTI